MREKTRQQLFREGKALTLKAAKSLVESASFSSWSGCLSGSGWSGTKVYDLETARNGRFYCAPMNTGRHQQNDAPTGWEVRGNHRTYAEGSVKRGMKLVILRRHQGPSLPSCEHKWVV